MADTGMINDIKSPDDIDMVMSFVKDMEYQQKPTWDVFRCDTFGEIIPELSRGFAAYEEKDGKVTGFYRAAATRNPHTIWVHEIYGTDGIDALLTHLREHCTEKGVTSMCFLTDTEWTRELAETAGVETGQKAAALVSVSDLSLQETVPYTDNEMTVFSRDPPVTTAASIDDLKMCYDLQLKVNWNELAQPPRVLIPDALFEGKDIATGHMVAARDNDGVIIGYGRVAYTFTRGLVYGEDMVIHPDYQKKGYGTYMQKALAARAYELRVNRAYGTIDPLNIGSLRLSTSKLNMTGVHVVENLFGSWDIHGENEPTHRLFMLFELGAKSHFNDEPDGHSSGADLSAFDTATVVEYDTGIALNDLDAAHVDGRKTALVKILSTIINERNFVLVGVEAKPTIRYKFRRGK